MGIFYVYILRCLDKNGIPSFYTGSTNDLMVRVEQHRTGKGARYTHGRELELVYFETHTTRSSAMKREYAIKEFTPEQKRKLVDDFQQRVKINPPPSSDLEKDEK